MFSLQFVRDKYRSRIWRRTSDITLRAWIDSNDRNQADDGDNCNANKTRLDSYSGRSTKDLQISKYKYENESDFPGPVDLQVEEERHGKKEDHKV
jgi:hypothetical protein